MNPRRRKATGERGFSLIEVLVALAIAGILMLAAAGIYWQQRAISRRLAAQRTADESLENAYELVRAGSLPLADASYSGFGGESRTLSIAVADGTVEGTRRLELVLSYRVQGHPFRRSLQVLVYAP